jgi:hypothetical protein
MDLEKSIETLFQVKDVKDTPVDTNSVGELKKIEQQLNKHLKSKQGLKYKKVNITADITYDSTKFSEVIEDEIKQKTDNKKWKGLPLYLKWQLLQTYFTKNDITDSVYILDIKSRLIKNNLQVEYENKEVHKII